MPQLDIVFEDEHLLIVNKPAGLLCVPGKTEPECLSAQAIRYNANCRVVHRLDMATSGLVIFAKSHPAQKAMGHLFERRKIHKTYHAVVNGQLDSAEGRVDLPLICDWPNRPRQKVCYETGKKAQTHYYTIEFWEECNATLLHLAPITGRSHQLRVHCQQIGHPILGDNLYNDTQTQKRAPRLLLHAAQLEFEHPISKKALLVTKGSDFNRQRSLLSR